MRASAIATMEMGRRWVEITYVGDTGIRCRETPPLVHVLMVDASLDVFGKPTRYLKKQQFITCRNGVSDVGRGTGKYSDIYWEPNHAT